MTDHVPEEIEGTPVDAEVSRLVPPFAVGSRPVTSVAPPARFIADVESIPEALLCTIPAVERLERVRPEKVGDAPLLIFWTVLTAPDETEKLVELNEAIPLATADASSMVMVEPPVELFASVIAPESELRLVTPPPEHFMTLFEPSTQRLVPEVVDNPVRVTPPEKVQAELIVWVWLSRVM